MEESTAKVASTASRMRDERAGFVAGCDRIVLSRVLLTYTSAQCHARGINSIDSVAGAL